MEVLPTHASTEDLEASDVMNRAAEDVPFFATLCSTPYGRLPEYPFFVDLLLDFASGEDVIVAKTRQMMATWAACTVLLHRILFKRGYSAGVTSRKERLVDDGGANSTVNSLLGRVRHLYASLPPIFPHVEFNYLRVVCPSTGSFIVGEGATQYIFRGSSLENFLGDEWAFVPQSRIAYSSARQACHCGAWLVSTPFGSDGSFADTWTSNAPSFRRVRLHWTKHPRRFSGELDAETGRPTSDWYRAECAKLILPDSIARELDIDFSMSASGLVYPEFSIDRHMRSDLRYDSDLPLYFGLDFGIGAATAGVVFQVHGREAWILADYEVENAPAEVNARNLWAVIQRLGFRGEMSEVRGFGDPAGNAREIASGSTVIREYRNAGFVNFNTPRFQLRDGIRMVRRKLFRGEILVSTDCDMLARRVADYRYQTDDSGAVKGDEPIKNRATHLMDGLRYGMTGVFPIDESTATAPRARVVQRERLRDVPDPSDYDRPIARYPARF